MRPGLELVKTSILIIGTLLPIVNPLGNAPIFLSLTRGFGSDARAVLSRKIALNGFVLLLVSMLIGTHILAFFGISLPVVQVAGGMVLIATGWELLHRTDDSSSSDDARRSTNAAALSQQAFYPLTLPLTVGPGSISVAITLGASRTEGTQWNWPVLLSVFIGPALIALAIYLCYRYAEDVARAVGDTAMNVILRLSSFILMCIGVQILTNGAASLLRSR